MDANSWVAVYAAIVATGALALEVRRWFESGPQIKLRVQPNMVVAGSEKHREANFVIATVRNRGSVATTITTLAFVKYPSRIHQIIGRMGKNFVVPRPDLDNTPTSLPHVLVPGTQWLGFIKKEGQVIPDFEDGTVVVQVYTSDRDRPYRFRIPKSSKPKQSMANE